MNNIIKQGKLRADKVQYPDGIGCCIWYPISNEDENVGICFDFSYDDIDDFLIILNKVSVAKADLYVEVKVEPTQEDIYSKVIDLSRSFNIQLHPFNWRLKILPFLQMIWIGPFKICW